MGDPGGYYRLRVGRTVFSVGLKEPELFIYLRRLPGMQQETAREAVGVFDNIQNLNEAVAELETTAFPRHDISVLSGSGHRTKTIMLEDSPEAPRTILIRPEEEAVGVGVLVGGGMYAGAVTAILVAGNLALSVFLTALAMGAVFGGILGAVVAWLLGRYYDGILHEQIKEGGAVLWVRAGDESKEQLACAIMSKHGGRRVHIHDIH
jgi:hypothetical protein